MVGTTRRSRRICFDKYTASTSTIRTRPIRTACAGNDPPSARDFIPLGDEAVGRRDDHTTSGGRIDACLAAPGIGQRRRCAGASPRGTDRWVCRRSCLFGRKVSHRILYSRPHRVPEPTGFRARPFHRQVQADCLNKLLNLFAHFYFFDSARIKIAPTRLPCRNGLIVRATWARGLRLVVAV